MRNHTYIIAKEGWLFLGIAIGLWCLSLMFDFLPWVFLAIVFLLGWAYRNPERVTEEHDELALVAPIDGKIKEIKQADNPNKEPSVLIKIQGAPYMVSVLRAPSFFTTEQIITRDGLNISLESKHSFLLNTKKRVSCKGYLHSFWIDILSGTWGKKIYFYKKKDSFRQGERIGFALGAEVCLYFPLSTRIRVNEGEYVYGGQSIFGYLQSEK